MKKLRKPLMRKGERPREPLRVQTFLRPCSRERSPSQFLHDFRVSANVPVEVTRRRPALPPPHVGGYDSIDREIFQFLGRETQ